jgi:hypothetical protein
MISLFSVLLLSILARDLILNPAAIGHHYGSSSESQLTISSLNFNLTKEVGGGPEHIAVIDVNNDGYLDIITANYWDNNVSIILWNSSKSDWNDQITKSVGGGPSSVFVGDSNSDGFNDIIVSNYWDGNISILTWNTTLGDWEYPITKSVGNGPESVFLGDVNNDGYNDIVTANNWDNTISLLIWNGSLGFWNPEITESVGDGPEDIIIGDANNDGLNDTIITNYSDDTISLFTWNESSNKWNPEVILAVGNGPGSISIEDANNDGYNDLITANYVDDSVSILTWSNSTKFWNQEITESVGDGPECVLVDDINIDGYNDIITANYGDNDISILIWNTISSEWNPQFTKIVGNGPGSAVVEDINYDGYNDVIISNFQDNNVSILIFTTTPIMDDKYENNDDLLTASFITNNTVYTNLTYIDLDYYYFNVSEGFLIAPIVDYAGFDPKFYLYLYNSSLDLIASTSVGSIQHFVNDTDIFYLGIFCLELYTPYNLTINLYPLPGNFSLTSDADNPDIDGNFTISWSEAEDAANYSIYQHSAYITEININITLIEEGINNTYYLLNNYINGTYYFIILATNFVGSTLSNCFSINVSIPAPPQPPGNFTLSSNAMTPDTDGNFTLIWTTSIRAENYSVYQYSNFISEINSSLNLITDGLANYTLNLFDYVNGTYYFITIAFNPIGNTTSNCIKIEVAIPYNEPSPPVDYIVPSYNVWFLILVFTFALINIIRKRKKILLSSV